MAIRQVEIGADGARVYQATIDRAEAEARERIAARRDAALRKEQNNARIHDDRDKSHFKTGKAKRPGIYDHSRKSRRHTA